MSRDSSKKVEGRTQNIISASWDITNEAQCSGREGGRGNILVCSLRHLFLGISTQIPISIGILLEFLFQILSWKTKENAFFLLLLLGHTQ